MKPPTHKPDRIAFRDSELRDRLQSVVERSGGKLTLSDIIRSAIEEKLERLEDGETFQTVVKLAKTTLENAATAALLKPTLGATPSPESKTSPTPVSQKAPKKSRKSSAA